MQRIMSVVAPPKVTDVKSLVTMVEDWERRIKELQADTGECITDVFKMAIMTAMMPESIQEYIFQQSEDTASYKKTKDKVVALANNRATMQQGPVPMDVGNVGRSQGCHGEEHQCQHHPYEHEIDYANAGIKCYRCGGFGHTSRVCPTEGKGGGKGGGKGDQPKGGGKGKGSGKWDQQQGDPKGKGKGKGYQGTCFKCGKVGHKAAECWNHRAYSVEEEESEEPVEERAEQNVERMWLVAGVNKKIVKPKVVVKDINVVHKNIFQELAEAETNVAENEEVRTCGMVFHLTDARRMLASVDKIVEAGHRVHFAKKESECFIEHVETGAKIYMKKENGVYVIKVWVRSGDTRKRATIVIDSGASECVMPKDWLAEVPRMKPTAGIRFTCAKGNDLGNYGRKLIEFRPIFTRPA